MKKFESVEGNIRINDKPFCVQPGILSSDFEVHSHGFSELVIITEGTAAHIIDNEEYRIKAGDVYVIGGDTAHGFRDVRSLSMVNIMYYPDALFPSSAIRTLPGYQALFVLEPQCRKEYGFRHKLQLSTAGQSYVRDAVEIMRREYDSKLTGCEAVLQSYFLALVAYLSREYTQGSADGANELMNLANAVAYMESHYMEPITLKFLSDTLSISTRHFIRIFQRHYNATPIDHILRLRLEHALELLKDTRWNITEIAGKCGFADSNYFSRQFRSRYGLSPRGYRAMIGGR